eukprot:1112205-Prymnesium_polylepis.1
MRERLPRAVCLLATSHFESWLRRDAVIIVLSFDPRHPSANSPSQLGGHSEGRRDGLPKGLDVGE